MKIFQDLFIYVPTNTYFKTERGFFCAKRALENNREIIGIGDSNISWSFQVIYGVREKIGFVCFMVDNGGLYDVIIKDLFDYGALEQSLPDYFRKINIKIFYTSFQGNPFAIHKYEGTGTEPEIEKGTIPDDFLRAINFAYKQLVQMR